MEKERILVVDDDNDILVLLSHLLGAEGYDVVTVKDSVNAYEIILRFAPDLIILDIRMPSLDGHTLLKLLKQSEYTKHISVIFCSADSHPKNIGLSLEGGADDFLEKPIHPEVLRGKVKKAMERIKHRKMTHNIISRYLGPDVAQMIIKEPGQMKIYGIKRRIACLFADIRGFSNISSIMEPEEVVTLLNRVLSDLSDAVFSIGGTIDKFLGDGLMAFWGAPLPNDNSELLAVEAALLMLEKMNEYNLERRYPGGLEILLGIGISSGEVVVGNIGSERRTDYTVIGESVNIAASLEKLARGKQILITGEVCARIKDKYQCSEIGVMQIKGSSFPAPVYEVKAPAKKSSVPIGAFKNF